MKSNELRIGNLIRSTSSAPIKLRTFEIEEVLKDRVVILGHKFMFDYLEPIPLTEEWLLKFGFDENQDLLVRGFIMRCSLTNQTIELIRYETLIDFEIKYVHQLQNLYFALTGEELILKEQ